MSVATRGVLRVEARCGAMWLVVLLLPIGQALGNPIAGPWWPMALQQLECRDPQLIKNYKANFSMQLHSFPRSANELQRVSGEMYLDMDFDDSLHATVSFDSFNNKRWKNNAIAPWKIPRGACSIWRSFLPDLYTKLFGLPADSKNPCSIPPGHYEIHDKRINWTYPPIPNFFYGHYRLHLVGGKDKEENFCFGLEFKVFPK